MIVVDSSALLAIIFDEPERQSFEDLIARDEQCLLSAVNGHETACVLRARHGEPEEIVRLQKLRIGDGRC